ncbi:uncharacterized protein [Anoplolepis gracilipes]|uniref:uncharacterized protein n=1 Tax=Anoplolepis gracilipes TaxID=354296 RepID=UPI003BA2A7C5
MLKIITISCILAVSLNFQEVKGLLLPTPSNIPKNPSTNPSDVISKNSLNEFSIPDIISKNPLHKIPIPDIPKNPLTNISIPDIVSKNPLQNISIPGLIPKDSPIARIIDEIPNLTNDVSSAISKVQSSIEISISGIIKKIQDIISTCSTAFDDGRDAVKKLSSAINSCIKKSTNTFLGSTNIQKLTDVANDVQKILTEDVHNMLQCLQNPLDVTSCLGAINGNLKHLAGLNELAEVAISEAVRIYPFNLFKIVPDVVGCIEGLASAFNLEFFCKIVGDTGKCINSIMQLFK